MADSRWRRVAGFALALTILAVAFLSGLEPAQALGFRGRKPGTGTPPQSRELLRSGAGLQEVAPPAAVQQLREALTDRVPQLSILSPVPESLLPDGPWQLRLHVEDWPLVDAAALGLGPHLVVQLDGSPPRQITDTEVTMPALTPGSHLLTVYAARPWGEAVKSPGAFQQLRLHRTAPNVLPLPAAESPQLIPVSPAGPVAGPMREPVLLDWLLLDAPLQNLRADDPGWRLRVTVNGDSFLVDRQVPLWLKGWQRGANSLLMELVDARGEPLNPPFNSLLQEVIIGTEGPPERWRGSRLEDTELAQLLGTLPPPQAESGPSEQGGKADGTTIESAPIEDPKPAVVASGVDAEPQEAGPLPGTGTDDAGVEDSEAPAALEEPDAKAV